MNIKPGLQEILKGFLKRKRGEKRTLNMSNKMAITPYPSIITLNINDYIILKTNL